MYYPSPRKHSLSRKQKSGDLVVLVAADLCGVKRNMRFVFPTRPTLRELTHQVEQAYQREAVMQEGGARGKEPEFKVSHLAVYSDDIQTWIKLVRQSQLAGNVQLYAFQKRTRGRGQHTPSSQPGHALTYSPSPLRGRQLAQTPPASPRSNSAIRRALLDQIRFVFNCLATPNTGSARSLPASPSGSIRAPSPRRFPQQGDTPSPRGGGQRSIGSSMVIQLGDLGGLLLRRGVHDYADVVRSLMASVDSAYQSQGIPDVISLAQFVRWGRRHPETVHRLYSRCESMRWAAGVEAPGGADRAPTQPPPASGASLATPVPVPRALPPSPGMGWQGDPVPLRNASPVLQRYADREHLEAAAPRQVEVPLHLASEAHVVSASPGHVRGLQQEVPLVAACHQAEMQRLPAVGQYPAEAPPHDSLPPASPAGQRGVLQEAPPVVPVPGVGVAGVSAAAAGRAHYAEWRHQWLEAEIQRLEAEHHARVAALRADAQAALEGAPPAVQPALPFP